MQTLLFKPCLPTTSTHHSTSVSTPTDHTRRQTDRQTRGVVAAKATHRTATITALCAHSNAEGEQLVASDLPDLLATSVPTPSALVRQVPGHLNRASPPAAQLVRRDPAHAGSARADARRAQALYGQNRIPRPDCGANGSARRRPDIRFCPQFPPFRGASAREGSAVPMATVSSSSPRGSCAGCRARLLTSLATISSYW
jgi:hypothetical protein